MSRVIRIHGDVAERIAALRRGRETPNDTIRRTLGLPPTSAGEHRAGSVAPRERSGEDANA